MESLEEDRQARPVSASQWRQALQEKQQETLHHGQREQHVQQVPLIFC